jgi:surface polysaccharide O-acyltransferase-like enzyme
MEKLNQLSGRTVNVDMIRTVAIVGVILLHASGQWLITPQQISQMNPSETLSWAVVDIYQSLAVLGVPLFLMLTGALLLQPEKNESLSGFFRKRWVRIGLPFLFWSVIYFVWDFLVIKIPFTSEALIQGILNGPYTQFWYLYVLFGLYLLTPILRIFIAHADKIMMKYFIIIWILGVAVLPFLTLLTNYTLNNNVFVLTGFVGYFILGVYLLSIQIRRLSLWTFIISGVALTALGTYVLAATVGGTGMYFLQEYFSLSVIFASVMVFLLLLTFPPPSVQKESKPSLVNRLVKLISENTLAIFLFHVIVLESIQNGYFGFSLSRNTLNPAIEAPLMTVIVLFVSLVVVVLLKKIPYLKKLIG